MAMISNKISSCSSETDFRNSSILMRIVSLFSSSFKPLLNKARRAHIVSSRIGYPSGDP